MPFYIVAQLWAKSKIVMGSRTTTFFGTLQDQVHTKQIFSKIQEIGKNTLLHSGTDKTLPWGQTPGPFKFNVVINGATNAVH